MRYGPQTRCTEEPNDVLVVCTHNGISLVRRPGAGLIRNARAISSPLAKISHAPAPGASKIRADNTAQETRRSETLPSGECSSRKAANQPSRVPPSFSDIIRRGATVTVPVLSLPQPALIKVLKENRLHHIPSPADASQGPANISRPTPVIRCRKPAHAFHESGCIAPEIYKISETASLHDAAASSRSL